MDESFVNPYTFVPLPERGPQRGAPNGHEGHPELLTGKLSVRIKAATPLLIRGLGERGEDGQRTNTLPRRPEGTAFIPGSSHKGAIRSLHETLSGSCLRVFDPDFVPNSYRESAQERSRRVLAVVTRAPTAEQPPKVKLCKKGDVRKDRLHQDRLRRLGGELRSGQRLNIRSDGNGEPQVEPASEGEWVLFLSDGAARKKDQPYHAHVRRVSKTEVFVPEDVWEEFKAVVEDTDDRRTGRRSQTEGKSTAPIDFEYEPKNSPPETIRIGHRYLAGQNLECGQPVWVDVDPGQRVTWLGLAMNWRHRPSGTTTAGGRVGAFQACDDPQQLCPSCRLFGSIDATERSPRETADQRAYRGHVRFGDAWAVGEPSGVEVTLPPMGAPRPGAGQAYLDNRKISPGAKDDPALREWGAPGADGKNPRPLRGRKHYWQAAPNGREQARAHHLEDHADLTTSAEVFPEGTEFHTTITFTDVDEAQLGGLIAALQPSRLLDDSAVQTHIGGGKPLGFGQCLVEIDTADSEVHHNGSRYGLDQPKHDLAEEVPALIDAFRASLRPAVTATWPLIHRVLHPEAVPGENVWYPPGASWKKRNTGDKEDHKKFDDGFAFWKQTAGFSSSREAGSGYPLTSLPQLRAREDQDGDGDDQAMDIVEKDS